MNRKISKVLNRSRITHRKIRGFLVLDALIGITICILLLMALSITVTRQARAERTLSAIRTQARNLETAMLTLQAGGAPGAGMQIFALPDFAPPGWAWVRLSTPPANDMPAQSLVGLVPRQTLLHLVAQPTANPPAGGPQP